MHRSFLLFCVVFAVAAENGRSGDANLWFGGSGGFSTEGIAVAGNFNLVADPGVMLTFTFDHAWDKQGDADFNLFSSERHTESFSNLGFMAGYLFDFADSSDGSISFQIGIAKSTIVRNGEYIENTFLFGPFWEKLTFEKTSFLASWQFHYRKFFAEIRHSGNGFVSAQSMLFGYRIGSF